ncbi:hypothetical protein EYZ11_012713 [Aspergillus tanneri]|uniref:Uncharacterized protein n=1 Tax=Aspergillus tanneri TaxID=1220188 RepID=A0A4S3J024_9EURO|nr:hypothetical protein EYZ11_012713 [Aspergillus tanneri]
MYKKESLKKGRKEEENVGGMKEFGIRGHM